MIKALLAIAIANTAGGSSAVLVHMPASGPNTTLASVPPGASATVNVDLQPGDRIKLDKGNTGATASGSGTVEISGTVGHVELQPRNGSPYGVGHADATASGSVTFTMGVGDIVAFSH